GAGDLNKLTAFLARTGKSDLLQHVSYSYLNLHPGLELGARRAVFFIHGGLSFLHADLGGSGSVIQNAVNRAAGPSSGVLATARDVSLDARALSAKLGLVVYLD